MEWDVSSEARILCVNSAVTYGLKLWFNNDICTCATINLNSNWYLHRCSVPLTSLLGLNNSFFRSAIFTWYHNCVLSQFYPQTTVNSYSASNGNWCTATLWNRIMTAQCEGMGEVGSARYEPALLPPCPSIRVLSYSNCHRSTQSHQQSKG